MFKNILVALFATLFSLQVFANALAALDNMLPVEQAHQDITQWMEFLQKTHPDLAYTVPDVAQFQQKVEQIKTSIQQPISVRNFWRKLAPLNSGLSDGHIVITHSNKKQLISEHLKQGHGLFPFAVVFDQEGLIIKSRRSGEKSPLAGYAIKAINGVSIDQIIQPLLLRTNGDSHEQRKAMLQRRFASDYWLHFGNADEFTLDLIKQHSMRNVVVAASHKTAQQDKTFADTFQFSLVDQQTGLLTIKSFLWLAQPKRPVEFMAGVFKQIKQAGISHLIIDIRENGGGDDYIWMQGILPYIADKSWRTGSTYKVKVLEGRADKGEKVGDVIDGEISTINKAEPDNLAKFDGLVSVLIGPYTYSSAILFANVIQDHGFGQLVGEVTGGKSGQTGGIQVLKLSHSALEVVSPRFYLTRPSGDRNMEPVTPDIKISYDKTQPKQLISKLIDQHKPLAQ